MEKAIIYKRVVTYLKKKIVGKKKINILEIGCGSKIYKDYLFEHNYEGLDLPHDEKITRAKWTNKSNLPEIEIKLENFKPKKNYDLIFSVGTIFMLDDKDLENFIKIISELKKNGGEVIIFDYKTKTINGLIKNQNDGFVYRQNNYLELIKNKFEENFLQIDIEWCSNNFLKNITKETFGLNKSHIIELKFLN